MNRNPGFAVDEIRGRMLHAQLLREAHDQIEKWSCGTPVTLPPHQDPPDFPTLAVSDTGTVRAIVVAV